MGVYSCEYRKHRVYSCLNNLLIIVNLLLPTLVFDYCFSAKTNKPKPLGICNYKRQWLKSYVLSQSVDIVYSSA